MNDVAEAPAAIGHNLPPSLTDELTERYKELLDRFAELKTAAESAPDKITDDATQGKVQELIKQLRVLWKQLDGTREVEKEPFAKAVSEVNGFFKTRMDPLKALGEKLKERSEAFLKAKAEAERVRLEEEAKRRREEADRAIAEAAEAERKKREAEEAKRRAEQEAAEAEERRRQAEADRKAAEEATRRARDEQAAAEAATQAAEAKEREREATESRRAATTSAREHGQTARTAGRDERLYTREAEREEARAGRMEHKAGGPEAGLARTRSELGTVGTLAERWTYRIIDRQKIPLERLRPFINPDAIEAAVSKFMAAGNRELPGVVFEKVSEARVL